MQPKQGYLTQVKQSNLSAVLRSIWQYEPISRIELVEKTELTSGTMTNLTQELLKAGVIRESEASSGHVGRKRVLLRLNAGRYQLVGIDISRNSFEIAITDLQGRIISSYDASTVGMEDPGAILDKIVPALRQMTDRLESANTILGIGVSIPGPMDLQRGVLLDPPNFPGWSSYPIGAELERRLGQKVQINDDARSSALAERWFGLGRRTNNLVHVTMGMGIGGGVVMDGQLLYGANGLYGQVGHITVDPNGEICGCGNRGCWETVGSIPAILRRWPQGKGKTIQQFFQAVEHKEPEASECHEHTLSILVSTLTTLFNVYDPEVIVLSGKLYPYLAASMEDVSRAVQSRVYSFARNRVRIEASTFGTSQSAVGAAALVFDGFMREPLNVLGNLNKI